MPVAAGIPRALSLAACVIAAVVAAPALAQPDSTADWTATVDADVKWQQTTPSGVLVVGTGASVFGIDGASGKVLWQLEGLENSGLMVLPQPPYGLLQFKRDAKGITRMLVDLESGRQVWDSSTLGMSEVYRQRYVAWRDAFLIAGKTAEGEVVAMVDAPTGRRLNTLAVDKHDVRALFDWPLFFDTESTLTVASGDRLTRYRLSDGALAWTSPKLKMGDMDPCDPLEKQTKKGFFHFTKPPNVPTPGASAPERTDPRPLLPFADMTSTDGRSILTVRGSKLHALAMVDGKPVWNDVPEVCGRCVEIEGGVEGGILLKTMQELQGSDALYLIDAASGAIRWHYPPPATLKSVIHSVFTDAGHLSNPLVGDGVVYILSGKDLVSINLVTGIGTALGATRISANETSLCLEPLEDGFLVSGPQDMEWFDAQGRSVRSVHHDPPGDAGLGLALLGLSVLADTGPGHRRTLYSHETVVHHGPPTEDHAFTKTPSSHYDVKRTSMYIEPNYKEAEKHLHKDYHASAMFDTLAFMLADLHEGGIDGPALVGIGTGSGQTIRRIPVSKKPRYTVDVVNRRLFVIEGKTIRGHAL